MPFSAQQVTPNDGLPQNQIGADNDVGRHCQSSPCSCLHRIDTISTNATEDDRAGPGRAMDKLFQYLGLGIEHFLGRVALATGHGPTAAEDRVAEVFTKSMFREYRRHGDWDWNGKSSRKAMSSAAKDCKKLIKYLRYSVVLLVYRGRS